MLCLLGVVENVSRYIQLSDSYRKKIHDPLSLYNAYIQTYNRYFHGFFTQTRKTTLNNKQIEKYFIDFGETHFHKLSDSLSEFRHYLTWCFSKYDKTPIFNLHLYIDEYLKSGKISVESFYFKILTYMKKSKIQTWDTYTIGTANRYPRILEHYIATKEIPFEFLLWLKVIDNLTPFQKKCMKVVLRHELMDLDRKLDYVRKNYSFFENELNMIGKELYEK